MSSWNIYLNRFVASPLWTQSKRRDHVQGERLGEVGLWVDLTLGVTTFPCTLNAKTILPC